MKIEKVAILVLGIAISGCASAKQSSSTMDTSNLIDMKGTVQSYVLNPRGEVEGFILSDGTQIAFPANQSSQLTQVIAPKDSVNVKGYRQNQKVFAAEMVTNSKTSNSIARMASDSNWADGKDGKKASSAEKLDGLPQLTAQGKVQSRLYGMRGELCGVVLSDGTIVHFAPNALENADVTAEIGQNLHATGPGTKNIYGESIQANDVSNE